MPPVSVADLHRKRRELNRLVREAERLSRGQSTTDESLGQAHRDRMAARSREIHSAAADIGEIPAVVNPDRREACRLNLHRFLSEYFPHSTGLKPFSEDHRRAILRMQDCGLSGGRNLNVFPRGGGKTTISENATLWLTLYGHRRFVAFFGLNLRLSTESLDAIKMELAENELLHEDFPEVCHPFQALEGRYQRCRHQTYKGHLTYIACRGDTVVFPTIPGSQASGAIIVARPYAKARGIKFRRPDGKQVRPDFAIVDDPQDYQMACSAAQIAKNLAVLRKDIAQGGGHQRKMSVIVNATVIAKGDLVDSLLADPIWQGQRIKMVHRWPDAHETHWLKTYREIRRTYSRGDLDDQRRAHREATGYYAEHREEMDRGGEVFWEHCFDPDTELSAIQHAYNILIDDGEQTFASECQNEPLEEEKAEEALSAEVLTGKRNGLAAGVVPKSCHAVSAYVDVHKRILYYVVSAWEPEFGGAVIEYGTWPKQPLRYFGESNPPKGLDRLYGGTEESWILAGLTALVGELLGHEFRREDGAILRIGRLLIDAGYKTELVRTFCRRHPQAALVGPALGHYIGATSKPFADYRPEPGAQLGLHWRMPPGRPHVSIDTNWWKTFAAARLALPLGSPGGWELFGTNKTDHQLFIDHCLAEEPVKVAAKGREVIEWKWRPGRPDNHWWDCLCGSAAAGSMLGSLPSGTQIKRERRRVSLGALAGRKK